MKASDRRPIRSSTQTFDATVGRVLVAAVGGARRRTRPRDASGPVFFEAVKECRLRARAGLNGDELGRVGRKIRGQSAPGVVGQTRVTACVRSAGISGARVEHTRVRRTCVFWARVNPCVNHRHRHARAIHSDHEKRTRQSPLRHGLRDSTVWSWHPMPHDFMVVGS